jgi:hypothetical protein
MTSEQRAFFEQNGYVDLGQVLSGEELVGCVEVYDRDRSECGWSWRLYGHHQTINCDGLVTSPTFDDMIRHPRVLPAIETLMGGPVCFSEICVRHMGPYEGEIRHAWHRDRPRWQDHPLRMDYIQLMLYLSDVDETSHCFSISPENLGEQQLDQEEQLKEGGIVDLHGPAGTAILFNISVLHTATVRQTQRERRTVQVYYGHRARPYLSDDSAVPASLWRDHPDAETRAFYGNLNVKTRRYAEAFGA